MDDADHAAVIEEHLLAIMLAARKHILPATGFCENCEESCEGHYCSAECREDSERRNRAGRA